MKTTSQASKRRGNITGVSFATALTLLGTFPVLILPAAAQDDEHSQDWRYMTVLQRPREQYDAQGIPVGGGLGLLPSLDVTGAYDDNIYAQNTPTASDFFTTISPKLELQSKWSRHKLTLDAYADIHRYIDKTTENNEEYGAKGDLALDLARGGSLDIAASYGRQTIARGNPENSSRQDGLSSFTLSPEQVDLTDTKVTWGQKFSYLLLGASAEFLDWQETSALNRDKDRKEYTGTVRVGYIFSPALNAFVEPFYTDRDFDRAVDSGGVNRDSKVMGVNGGVGYDITGVLYGETKVGWYTTDFAQPGVSNNSGLSIQSNTTWNPTARDTVLLTVERTNVVSTDITDSSRVMTGAALEYQHELRSNIVARVDFSYYNDKFIGSDRVDHQYEAGLRGDYYFDRHVSFFAKYQRDSVDSSVDFFSYDENLVMVGIHAQI